MAVGATKVMTLGVVPLLVAVVVVVATPGMMMEEDQGGGGGGGGGVKEVNASVPVVLLAEVWDEVVLDCPSAELASGQSALWATPKNRLLVPSGFSLSSSSSDGDHCVSPDALLSPEEAGHVRVRENGSLVVGDFGWGDRGRYRCLLHSPDGDIDLAGEVEVHLRAEYRQHIYYFSLMYGGVAAGGVLLLTLLYKLVYWLLETYGCCLCCCCCENQLPPKAKKIKVALESIEAYKAQQLDKLKDNYTQQSEWIRQNCAVQMEKVRDNYNSQVQNIKDIKQYGSSQIQAVREQYFEQMNRIRDYSSSQLDRVHENYIFQRQRLRKFSAQNYLRVRATGKSTQRTLNKVIEHLPPLYLDLSNCRQGMGGRQESMHFPDFQIGDLEPFEARFDMDINGSVVEIDNGSSLYFTPHGTPQRELGAAGGANPNVTRKTSSLKNTPTREAVAAEPYRAIYKAHKKSKSISTLLPQKWLFSAQHSERAGDHPGGNGGGHQRTVRAIIEHVASATGAGGSSDYLDEASNLQPVEVRDRTARVEEIVLVAAAEADPSSLPALPTESTPNHYKDCGANSAVKSDVQRRTGQVSYCSNDHEGEEETLTVVTTVTKPELSDLGVTNSLAAPCQDRGVTLPPEETEALLGSSGVVDLERGRQEEEEETERKEML